MLKSPKVFKWPYVNSSAWPTLNPGIVNKTDVTFDMDTDPPENSRFVDKLPLYNFPSTWNNWYTRLNVNSTRGALKNSMKTILTRQSEMADLARRATRDLYRNFIWGVRTSTPVDLGNYNA